MHKTKIRFLAAILCMALLALCACGSLATPEETTAPAADAPTLPIAPASYRDAPEAYWPVLDDLRKCIYLAENYRDYNIRDDWGLTPGIEMLLDSLLSMSGEYIGYAVQDINADGTPELIILFSPPGDKLHPCALFTLQDSAPVHLYTYHFREVGSITADGIIYVSYATAPGGNMRSYRLEPGAAQLTLLTNYDYLLRFDDEEEILALQKEHCNPPNPMQLTFIPIEQ